MSYETIYLSTRKLDELASRFDITPPSATSQTSTRASADISASLTPALTASVQVSRQRTRATQITDEDTIAARLGKVVTALEKQERVLPDLDRDDAWLQDGDWFRFRRHLRFGIGASDDGYSVRAFLFVDTEDVTHDGLTSGLLLHGSLAHVCNPYRPDDIDTRPGSRSGSGTGALFAWAVELHNAYDGSEALLPKRLQPVLAAVPRGRVAATASMYHMYADGRAPDLQLPLINPAPCEGVARVSIVAAEETTSVVLASPLYVRTAPSSAPLMRSRRRPARWLSSISPRRS